jgi:hypothetical protein
MRSAGKILLLFSSLGVGAYALLAYSLTPLGSLEPSSFPRLRSSRKVGFATSSLFWLYSGTCALLAVRRGAIAEHRQWMVRNFALAFGAITLRLYLAAFIAAGIDFAAAYAMVAWLCWLPNVLMAEWIFNGTRPQQHSNQGRLIPR